MERVSLFDISHKFHVKSNLVYISGTGPLVGNFALGLSLFGILVISKFI